MTPDSVARKEELPPHSPDNHVRNNAATNAHRVCFSRLINVLQADLAVEPRYRMSNDHEWLAWAHGTRWHLVGRGPAVSETSRLIAH